jgi:hypothetical protein
MRIATAHHGSERRLLRTSMRTFGLAMVVLLAMAQVGAALHFTLVRHALSPQAGVLIHCDELAAPGPSGGSAPRGSHETCEVFAVLCQATTVSTPTPTLAAPAVANHDWAPAPPPRDGVRPWPIFMLAPSHSPPLLAA